MLQMKLSGSTIEACEDLAEIWYGEDANEFSRSFIVRSALEHIFPIRNEIEWEEVKYYADANYSDSPAGKQTALVLSNAEIEELTDMQREFVEIFGTKKIYKPFVVKMVVMAELFNHGMNLATEEREKEEFKDNVIAKIGTLNVHSAWETSEIDWPYYYESFERNDIMALQEVKPGDKCNWLKKCEKINDIPYKVITPIGWNKKYTTWTIAATLIREDILENYEPLVLNNDKKTFFARYTYGIVTLNNGFKFRLLNLYMPQLVDKDQARIEETARFWDNVLTELDSLPADEKVVLLGDLNAGEDKSFTNRENFMKLCKRMNMLDANENYNTWFDGPKKKRLDYIFISGSLAMDCIAVTNKNIDLLEIDVTDHVMLEVALVKQEPFKAIAKDRVGYSEPEYYIEKFD